MTDDLHLACAGAVHVLTTDGRTLKAGQAALFILGALGYPTSAWFGGLRPFIWGIEAVYQVVARHRPFFAKFFFTSE